MIEKNGFYVAIGKQGSGKTALITSLMVNEYNNENRVILSNYHLKGIPFILIDLPTILELIKSKELVTIFNDNDIAKQYENITGHPPTSNNDYLNNSIILLDEIHIYFHSHDFLTKESRTISAFASQLRKRNTLLLATTQYILKLVISLRKELKFVFDITKDNKMFKCEISEIDGYYTSPISSIKIDLKPYFKFYDTNEIIAP